MCSIYRKKKERKNKINIYINRSEKKNANEKNEIYIILYAKRERANFINLFLTKNKKKSSTWK